MISAPGTLKGNGKLGQIIAPKPGEAGVFSPLNPGISQLPIKGDKFLWGWASGGITPGAGNSIVIASAANFQAPYNCTLEEINFYWFKQTSAGVINSTAKFLIQMYSLSATYVLGQVPINNSSAWGLMGNNTATQWSLVMDGDCFTGITKFAFGVNLIQSTFFTINVQLLEAFGATDEYSCYLYLKGKINE